MKRLLLLIVVVIFSATASRAQMPHPDVLSDMIIKTLETRHWFSNYEFYTICFKYDGIEYPGEELNPDITNGLMRQLNKKSPNYRFRYAAPYRHELESIRKYAKKHHIKLPCSVMYLWIELTDSHETHIFAEPRRLNPAWKHATIMLSDGVSFIGTTIQLARDMRLSTPLISETGTIALNTVSSPPTWENWRFTERSI